ncbi:hypothetical protein Taro_041107, partial [Colocasia esculenta]|nr:hypothetical protein [Colocasia esculenta]
MSEVQGGSACGPSTLWRSEVAVLVVRRCFSRGCSVSFMVTPGVYRGVASACVDSDGFAVVVFGLTRVVVEAFLCFRCFVVLYGVCRGVASTCVDSAGSAVVVFGLTRVVVE